MKSEAVAYELSMSQALTNQPNRRAHSFRAEARTGGVFWSKQDAAIMRVVGSLVAG
jgi:hypothetical protein